MRVDSPDELAKLRPDLFTRGRPSVLVPAVDPESEFAGPSRGAQIEAAHVDVVEGVA